MECDTSEVNCVSYRLVMCYATVSFVTQVGHLIHK